MYLALLEQTFQNTAIYLNFDIDSYFSKIAAPILAFPLSVFLNHCLTFGTFPNRLKLAKVVPVFKKRSY